MEDRVPGSPRITILLVDDHDILRFGLRALLREHSEVEVVGEAATVAEAIEQARALSPDVVLMDARLPDGSGVDACREILSENPQIRVLFFSAYSDEQTVLMTLFAGASGYVAKDLDCPGLVAAIRDVAEGRSAIDSRVRGEVLSSIANFAETSPAIPAAEKLSPQEERVMALVVEGKTNKEIGVALGLSDKTVKNYLSNAMEKLNTNRRSQTAAMFIQHGKR